MLPIGLEALATQQGGSATWAKFHSKSDPEGSNVRAYFAEAKGQQKRTRRAGFTAWWGLNEFCG